jgi:hypothetical protein
MARFTTAVVLAICATLCLRTSSLICIIFVAVAFRAVQVAIGQLRSWVTLANRATLDSYAEGELAGHSR